MVNKTTSLEEYIDSFIEDSNLQEVIRSISTACKTISNSVRLAGINDLLGKTGDINVQGEKVEKLDEFANNTLINQLSKSKKVFMMGSEEIESIILPKKTIFQLCSLLEDYEGDVKISNIKSKIKFELNNSILISKLIDGKFPNYVQVIPKNNQKKLETDLKLFLDSVDRVASVSLDKKDGVKFNLSKDTLNLSVNNANSGDGKESLNVKFDHDLEISFNSRYLIDVASQLDGDKIEIFFNDTGSPALIKDPSDFDSIYVVMPMKG